MPNEIVQNLINEGFIKLISDKILQGIEKIENAPHYELRRWIWELMQNAKDVDNTYGSVTIEIELCANNLIFRHNGDPFEIQHLTSLVQQVSSKDDSIESSETTGKFGTGFITTHMLSKFVKLKGIVKTNFNRHQKFELDIDRRGRNSNEMGVLLKDSLSQILELDNYDNFPLQENYNERRKETDFDTLFQYPLDERGLEIARKGISDLEIALPYTLIFVPKIKSILIIDKIQETKIQFTRSNTNKFENLSVFQFLREEEYTRTAEYIYIAAVNNEDITLARRLNSVNEISIRKNGDELPRIFKDFPLVGTGNFNLPVVLNSRGFMPTESRDGIYLKNNQNDSVKKNQSLLKAALPLIQEFIQSSVNNGFKNLHHLAESSLPEHKSDYIDLNWYQNNIQVPLRRFLLNQNIVETEDSQISINQAKFPIFNKNSKKTKQFYDLCYALKWNKIPKREIHEEWLEILNPQYEKWGSKFLKYDIENLLSEVRGFRNIELLQEKLKNISAIDWLNEIITFLIAEEITNHLETYPIIPNQNGDQINLKHLSYNNNIPEELIEVLKTLGIDWNYKLIKKDIVRLEHHSALSVTDISSEINKIIAKIRIDDPNIELIEPGLFKLSSLVTSSDSNIRITLFKFAKTILFEKIPNQYSIIPGTSDFNWDPINKWITQKILKEIENQSNIKNLCAFINKAEENTLLFLNELIEFLNSKNDFKNFLNEYRCIPCQYGDFCYFSDLANDVDKTPDDLKDILYTLDRNEDWKATLLDLRIEINTTRQKTLTELCTKIDNLVRAKEKEDELNNNPENKKVVLRLLSRFKDNQLDYEALFKWLFSNKAQIQVHMMDNYQSEINRILENESILPQLAIIAESGLSQVQFNNLLMVAEETSLSPDELQHLLEAVRNLGSDSILHIVNQKVEEQRDFQFKEQIGQHAEDAFKLALTQSGLLVIREPIGQDYIIEKQGSSKEYHIEIKSIGANLEYVLVSSTQGKTAVSKPNSYALCVIKRTGEITTVEDFMAKAKFVTNIGNLLNEKVSIAADLEQKISSNNNFIQINFDNPTYKFKIYEQIWTNAFDFKDFITWLKEDYFI